MAPTRRTASLKPAPGSLWSPHRGDKGEELQTTREINPGECIVSEKPLLELPPIPSDVIDRDQLLRAKGSREGKPVANGIKMVKEQVKNMDKQPREALRKLHGPAARNERQGSPSESDMLIISKNVFTHEDTPNMSNLRVYRIISRINHSCRPNAIVEWNPSKGEGTLHALRKIAAGEEITIDYLCRPEDTLNSISERRKLLEEQYDFVCTCPACGHDRKEPTTYRGAEMRLEREAAITDQISRRRAGTLYAQIDFDEEVPIEFDRDQITDSDIRWRTAQLGYLDEYIDALKELGLRDHKLVLAYERRAAFMEMGAALAEVKKGRPKPYQKLKVALPKESYEHFLKLAKEEWEKALKLHWRCDGVDHPDSKYAHKKRDELAQKLLPFEQDL